MKVNPLKRKSYSFALEIIKLTRSLNAKKEFILGKQVLKSGTSIGAQISEAKFAQSRADFLSKMSIALKEANETSYWLYLLKDSNIISSDRFEEYNLQCQEIISLLAATVKTLKVKA